MEQDMNTVNPVKAAVEQLNSKPATSTSFKLLTLFSFMLAIALAAIIGVAWKKFLVAQKQLIYVEKNLIQQKKETQNLKQQLAEVRASLAKQQVELKQNNSELQRLLERNPNYMSTQTLLEIEHIVREANLNLNYSNNTAAAIVLLQAADYRAKTLTLSGIDRLRQQLAQSITALQMLPASDLESILAKITSLQVQLEHMPLFLAPKMAQDLKPKTDTNILVKDWRAGLAATWETIQKIIVIRHRNEPVAPLIAPEQQLYLQRNLQLQLQQAAWAAMQRQDKAYQASLQQTIRWIEQYYAANPAASAGIINILKALQKAVLKPATPDLMPILQTINQLQQQIPHSPALSTTAARAH